MKNWRIILICFLGSMQLTTFAAPKEKKGQDDDPKRVYMYGVAVDFNDSTTYITDVQFLDSVKINPDGSLRNIANYSLQLKVYLEGTLGETNQTCAIIYSDKKKRLEKRFTKMLKRLQSDKNKILKRIGTDAFMFQKSS